MIPVDQRYTQLSDLPVGDCLKACVASIFELDLQEVPHFAEIGQRTNKSSALMIWDWAKDYGLYAGFYFYGQRAFRQPRAFHPGYWIAAVRSTYSEEGVHAVVMLGLDVAHDPNPVSRERHEAVPYRFLGEIWFEPVDLPALIKEKEKA